VDEQVFRAPWCTALKVASAFSSVLLLGLTAMLVRAGALASGWGLVALLVIVGLLVVSPLWAVTGYTLSSTELGIRRLVWTNRLPLDELEQVAADPQALRGSWRLFGNGGLFSISGLFWSRRLGKYHAYLTDPRRAVIVRFRDRVIVLTPESPEEFVRALRVARPAIGEFQPAQS
jgi:hypothetical protein